MCEYCKDWKERATLYQTGEYCEIYIGKYLERPALGIGNMRKGCPQYADCSQRNWAPHQMFIINYCPNCGEKMDRW